MYGYGSSFSSVQSNALLASFGIYAVLGFIAFVAAIVVTVLLYRKFISDGAPQGASDKRDWRPFFRFETLLIDKILKALYIFLTCLIAFESAAAILAGLCSIIADPFGAIVGIILIAILCVVFEILNRLGFEQTMLLILVWRNTSDLRKGLVGDVNNGNGPSATVGGVSPSSPAAPADGAVPSQAASAVVHPAASAVGCTAVQEPSYGFATAQTSGWTCPSCGNSNKAGSFCAQCGQKKPE